MFPFKHWFTYSMKSVLKTLEHHACKLACPPVVAMRSCIAEMSSFGLDCALQLNGGTQAVGYIVQTDVLELPPMPFLV
eukprot:CAMPEP_0171093612 /NCGR_PEP_ID=MMETSP0766_2-20121228/39182_1 /TAXON_ID=439317 /ORGANISM="Gambierdiscus australes, Strain CAWD 149" /LENGTH=77 /DNA_ID=CAMNT_0011552089 /DNA_START=547 /DNA_END=780 /DNA_ORIENTATION=-